MYSKSCCSLHVVFLYICIFKITEQGLCYPHTPLFEFILQGLQLHQNIKSLMKSTQGHKNIHKKGTTAKCNSHICESYFYEDKKDNLLHYSANPIMDFQKTSTVFNIHLMTIHQHYETYSPTAKTDFQKCVYHIKACQQDTHILWHTFTSVHILLATKSVDWSLVIHSTTPSSRNYWYILLICFPLYVGMEKVIVFWNMFEAVCYKTSELHGSEVYGCQKSTLVKVKDRSWCGLIVNKVKTLQFMLQVIVD